MDVRIVESVAMFGIGDGLLTVLFPDEHCSRWATGPFQPIMGWCRQHPGPTRTLGAVQLVACTALAASLSKEPGPARLRS